jgi:hypothetical protein
MKAVNLIRYSTILDFLEAGPHDVNSIVENFEGQYSKNMVLSTLSRMQDKEYIKINKKNLVSKQKDAFYHEP